MAVDDPAELARAAHRLITERGLRQRLAAGARERACREFDQRLMAERCLNIYRCILTGEHIEDPVSFRKSA